MPTPNLPDADQLFRLLRQIDATPDASQRATAQALGISLGRLNTQLRAVTDAGLVALTERNGTDRRQRISYGLTAKGAAHKSTLVDQFLARKLNEYNALYAELTGTAHKLSPPKNRTSNMATSFTPGNKLFPITQGT